MGAVARCLIRPLKRLAPSYEGLQASADLLRNLSNRARPAGKQHLDWPDVFQALAHWPNNPQLTGDNELFRQRVESAANKNGGIEWRRRFPCRALSAR